MRWCNLKYTYCDKVNDWGECSEGYCPEDSLVKKEKPIPIEWIEKWADKNCKYCYDYDYPTEKTDGWYVINNLLNDWRKEGN